MQKDKKATTETFGNAVIEDHKGSQIQLRRKLMEMKPTIRFTRKLISKSLINLLILNFIGVEQGDFAMWGEESTEKRT